VLVLCRLLQTCLGNQLKDLYNRDLQRIIDGKAPLYLLSQYTYGYNVNVRGRSLPQVFNRGLDVHSNLATRPVLSCLSILLRKSGRVGPTSSALGRVLYVSFGVWSLG
jgi:hypothetical protein